MSQDDVQKSPPWAKEPAATRALPESNQDVTGVTAAPTSADHASAASAKDADPAGTGMVDASETVGTGTFIGLGCVAGTLLLIVFGLIYLALIAIF